MVYTDQTPALRALLPSTPAPAPAPVSSSSSRPTSPASGTSSRASSRSGAGPGPGRSPSSSRHGAGRKARPRSEAERRDEEEGRTFMQEAYRIHDHLAALSSNLALIRKPYLSLSEAPPLSRRRLERERELHRRGRAHDEQDHDGHEADDGWTRWDVGGTGAGAKYMTDKERQEVDVRSKMILRRCKERVDVMEQGEKARQQRVIPHPSALQSTLHALLPSLGAASSSSSNRAEGAEALITAHRAGVLWSLSSRLAGATQALADLQEERARRRAERGRTLGEGAGREAERMQKEQEAGFFGRALDSLVPGSDARAHNGASAGSGSAIQKGGTISNGLPPSLEIDPATTSDPAEPALNLSAEQIQQFENENNALVTHLSSTLSSVLAAEKSLLEIAQMQTQLVAHLAQQTELVDVLYAQAVGSVGEMRGAKGELVKAQQRGGEARWFMLIFLVGAGLALIFLDWYAA